MAQLVLELPQELRERIEVRSCEVKQKPERFVLMAIEQYLEDLEDAEEAQRVVAEISLFQLRLTYFNPKALHQFNKRF